jgi:hypothetical protein
MSNGTFNPIDVDGFGSFTAAAEPAGWYQLATPAATLPTIPGIVVPPGAQGIQLQAITDTAYCYAPGSVGSNPQPMLLAAGSTTTIFGQQWVQALCIKVDGTTAFAVQFLEGSIGPVPNLY